MIASTSATTRIICQVTEQDLLWTRPRTFKREYELRAGDELLSTLRWQKACSSLARAESVGGSWTFKRSGCFSQTVTARVSGSEADAAVFRPGWWSGGTLLFSDGRCYRWLHTSFWRSEWAFVEEGDQSLIHFKSRFAFWTQAAEVKVVPGTVTVPDLFLLIALGWYLMLLQSEDAAGAAAAVGAGS